MKKTFDPAPGRPWSDQLRRRRSRSEVEVSNPKLVLATTFKHKDDGHLTASQKDLSSAKPIQRTNCIVDDLITPMQRPRSRRLSCSMDNLKLKANDDKTEGVHLSLEANDNAGIDSPVVVCHDSIHSLLRGKTKEKRKKKELLHKLTYTDVDVNERKENEMTPLHIAAENGHEACAKVLIAFGADINAVNDHNETPLDLAVEEPVKQLLKMLQAQRGCEVVRRFNARLNKLHPSSSFISSAKQRHNTCKKLNDYILQKKLYNDLEKNLSQRPSLLSMDDSIAVAMQEKEIRKYNETEKLDGSKFQLKGGSRLLFLDGGGMKGLAQIEILCQIEQKTGRKITELFDWIVGTSTGAIIALGLVYGNLSLNEVRKLYFKMNETFKGRYTGITRELEEILKETLGADKRMNDVLCPRVLIQAVNKQTPNLQVHFFNNCFEDDFSKELVWKVARYTSAHPLVFGECDNYVDGGVLANNPCEYGMTAIQSYTEKLPIAVVVSIGTGIYKYPEKFGSVDLLYRNFFSYTAPHKLISQSRNLLKLLTNAILESEGVARNFKSRCEGQGIPFYRFSPHLCDDIGFPAKDTQLVDMIVDMKTTEAIDPDQTMVELTKMFHAIAEHA